MIDALEEFSSQRAETIEELLEWPWQRWQAMYAAFRRRKQRDAFEARRLAMVAGVWGNSNYDRQSENDETSPREEFVNKLDREIDKAIARIYEPDAVFTEPEDEIDFATIPLFGGQKLPDTSNLTDSEKELLEQRAALEWNLKII